MDCFTIDRNGSLSFDDHADSEVIERLLEHIYDEGFDIDQSHTEDEDEPCAVCVSMPKSLFTDSNLENLKALITAKGSLIKKALGVADLPLEVTDTKVSFPWFQATPTPDEMNAYDTFICKLCEMAWNQKRVNATEKPTDKREIRIPLLPASARLHRCGIQDRTKDTAEEPIRLFSFQKRRYRT